MAIGYGVMGLFALAAIYYLICIAVLTYYWTCEMT